MNDPRNNHETRRRRTPAHIEAWTAVVLAIAVSGAPAPVSSEVTVEQATRRAYIDYPEMGMHLAWDGEKAWSVGWKLPEWPRFMALLNYYFVSLPWLTQDPGVILSDTDTERIFDDSTEYVPSG